MARQILNEPSRTLAEYRLLPGFTPRGAAQDHVSLATVLAWTPAGERPLGLAVPLASAAMQAVSGPALAVALARRGGVAFLPCSQPVEAEAAMVAEVKAAPPRGDPSADGSPACDAGGRLLVVAAVNTHDHAERVPALVAAGADAVAFDSSDGHQAFQAEAVAWVRARWPRLPVIGGNVVTAAGFDFLAEAGVAAVKVGMGSGSICITQEEKGTGRGLATALIDVVQARDRHARRTGRHLPVIADGGVSTAKDAGVALAIGADLVMMGRWFARLDESPTEALDLGGRRVKPYWGEGAPRARAWREARYHQAVFAEGVGGFVDAAGPLGPELAGFLARLRATLSTCGAADLPTLRAQAVIEPVSALAIREGGVHGILRPGGESGDA